MIVIEYSVSLHLEKVDEVTDDGGSERTGILDAHLTSESEGEAFGSDWAPEADCNEDDEDFRLEGSFTAVDERPKRKAKIKALSSVKKKRTARRSVVKVSADVDNGEDDKVSKEGQEEESGSYFSDWIIWVVLSRVTLKLLSFSSALQEKVTSVRNRKLRSYGRLVRTHIWLEVSPWLRSKMVFNVQLVE